MYLTQSIKRNVQLNRNGIATIFGDRQQTWLQFQDRVAKFAQGLRDLGAKIGDRVAILALKF